MCRTRATITGDEHDPRGAAAVLVGVLGTIAARAGPDDDWVGVAGQQRVVLALLVAELGRPCRTDRLVQAVWGEAAPPQAPRLVQTVVSRLRRVLEPADARGSRLQTVAHGWLLDLAPDQVDAARFEQLVDQAALADDGKRSVARDHLEEAVGLWRGPPFGELADHEPLSAAARLEEKYVAAWQQLLRLRLAAGEPDAVVADAHQLVAAYPLRERLWALLMEAQYQAGQPADALATYQQLRERLADELGTEPNPDLQALHTAILRRDVLEPPSSPTQTPASPASRGRRTAGRWPCRRELPLAGRDDAFAALGDALAHARQGAPQLALIAGEPGIGKTRLVADFADATGEGVDVVAGRCTEGAGVPYQPVVEALVTDVEATGDDELAARLGRGGGELTRLMPNLGARTGWQPGPPSMSGELDQYRLFTAVAGWLAAASVQVPLVLVAEDLHAATRPTWLLLDHVVRTVGSARLMVVATYRDTADQLPDGLAEAIADWARRPDVTHVVLAGLDQAAVGELLATQPGSVAESPEWAAAVQAATGGNPLFIEELLAALETDPPPDPYQTDSHRPLPESVGQLLAARLRRLAPATTAWLDHAAIAGEQFDFTETTRASDLTDDQALDAVGEATAARLVTPIDGGDAYAFTHTVTRDALLARLAPSRRMRLHARFANTLEACYADDLTRVASRLAHHHTAAGPAGDLVKTRRYALAAGDQAMSQRAYDDAAAHYRHALQLTEASDTSQRCDLLIRLGRAQACAGHPDGPATLHEALSLALTLGEPDRIVEAALAGNRGFVGQLGGVNQGWVALLEQAVATVSTHHPGQRAVLLALLARELVPGADFARRRQLAGEALTLARDNDDAVVLARVLTLRWVAIQHPATLAERLADTAELVDLVGQLDDPLVNSLAHVERFADTLEAGDRAGADTAVDHACRVVDDLAHPALQARVISTAAARELVWGDCGAAHIAEDYRALGHRAGFDYIEVPYLAQQFLLHRECGRLADYLPLLDQALATYGAMSAWQALASLAWALTGHHDRAVEVLDRYAADGFAGIAHNPLWMVTLCPFAETAAFTHQPQPAYALLDQLAPYHDHLAIDVSVPLGAVAHYLGMLATITQKWSQAEGYLDEAADIHHRIGALRWHDRTLLARARLHLARNDPNDPDDPDEAIRLIDIVTTRARQHGHIGLFHEAHALASSVGKPEPSHASSSTLT